MKCVIAGSRSLGLKENIHGSWVQMDLEECPFVEEGVKLCDWVDRISEIVSGTARGIDNLGEQLAEKFDLEKALFPADWNRGRGAGHIRNKDMAIYCDLAIIFWDGVSAGTKNMIEQMEKVKKPYILYKVKGDKLCRVK